MRSSISLAIAACLTGSLVAAQKPGGVDPASRVRRAFAALRDARSWTSRVAIESAAGPLARQLKGTRRRTDRIEVYYDQGTHLWVRDREQPLAQRGAIFAAKDPAGGWLRCRRPEGAWRDAWLPDPRFLATVLEQGKVEWRLVGADTIDDKPMRVYRAHIEGTLAQRLVRSGALPGGDRNFALGAVIVLGGKRLQPGDPERKIDLTVYEDPATRLPRRIVADVYEEGGPLGNVRILVQGRGGANAEEDEEDGKKRPTVRVVFELADVDATEPPLPDAARAVLRG